MSLIAVHIPTDICNFDVKELFYAKLTSAADICPQQDIYIVLGDLRVVVGCDCSDSEGRIATLPSSAQGPRD